MPACSAVEAIKKKRSAEQLCIEQSLTGNKRAKLGTTQLASCDNSTPALAEKPTIANDVLQPANKQGKRQSQLTNSKSGTRKIAYRTKISTPSSNSGFKGEDDQDAHSEGDDEIGSDGDSLIPDSNSCRISDKPDDQGPNLTAKPLSNLREIIHHLLEASLKDGLKDFVDAGQHYIRVGTLCSGTDAPLHVMNLFGMLKSQDGERVFTAINVFGCEIEPFKQGFLLRNSKPQFLFRDARDFASDGAQKA